MFATGATTYGTAVFRFAMVSAMALTAGCASRPEGILVPVAAAPARSAAVVDMLVATSRKPTGDPGTLFSGERSPTLSLTDIAVSIPNQRQPGTVEWPRKVPPDPGKEFAVTRAGSLTECEARNWFRTHDRNGHVLLFVHGFNNRVEDSVFRFAQIVRDSGADVTPVLFSWPSGASITDYEYDKESTNYSRTAFERTLDALAASSRVTEITVMAHSMGTWLAMEGLRQSAIRHGSVSPKIKDVMLASPDLDEDVFARQWNELGRHRPRFTIFVSRDDRALALSRLISGGVRRVGAIDPSQEPYRSKLGKAGITAIDLTKVKSGDPLNHGKFAESPQVVQAIGNRLMDGQPLTDQRIGLGDAIGATVGGTIGAIGTVAATAASTPVRTLEGQTVANPRSRQPAAFDDVSLERSSSR